jgi:hypothetical protein
LLLLLLLLLLCCCAAVLSLLCTSLQGRVRGVFSGCHASSCFGAAPIELGGGGGGGGGGGAQYSGYMSYSSDGTIRYITYTC